MDVNQTTFDRRLIVGGRRYEITASGTGDAPLTVRFVGRDHDGRVVTEVTGEIPPDDLPAVADVITSTLAGLVAVTHEPARRRAATLAGMRQRHPNHGARWTSEDDARLVARHREGAGIPALMDEFGRNRGGIRSRLVQLGEVSAEDAA